MNIEKTNLENLIREILLEKLSSCQNSVDHADGVRSVCLPSIRTGEGDRLDTGNPKDQVYTKDLFSLSESARLGCGIMEMKETTFDWTLSYDEIDYVIEGTLHILIHGKKVTAHPGELILIPKGSSISFSVPEYARFLYVTYPADWMGQKE